MILNYIQLHFKSFLSIRAFIQYLVNLIKTIIKLLNNLTILKHNKLKHINNMV